jgi:protein O-GlcNAc transferase
MLALDLAERGQVREAIAHYTEALRIAPGDAKAHNNLGNALVLVGKVNEAIPHYLESLRLNPQSMDARRRLKDLKQQIGERK